MKCYFCIVETFSIHALSIVTRIETTLRLVSEDLQQVCVGDLPLCDFPSHVLIKQIFHLFNMLIVETLQR